MSNKKETLPIYHGHRWFLGARDLVISFYTEKCQFKCTFCSLPNRSSDTPVSVENIIHQIDWVFEKHKQRLPDLQQLSVGNEGSILDEQRFPRAAMTYLLEQTKTKMPKLEVISLETRLEYVKEDIVSNIQKQVPNTRLDLTVGLETQDDTIRYKLNKGISKKFFESKIDLIAELNVRLTVYVMLKPWPMMSDMEAVAEATRTVDYLRGLCRERNIGLVVYLNPTYISIQSELQKLGLFDDYQPPRIQDVFQVVYETYHKGTPIYTGLWNEDLADQGDDFAGRQGYESKFRQALLQFNKTHNSHFLLSEDILAKASV